MADISQIKLPNGTTYNLKDTISGYTTNTGTVTSVAVSGGTGISVSGSPITSSGTITITNSGVTGVKGNAESSYRTGQVNLTSANIGAIPANSNGNTQNLYRPLQLNGCNDNTLDSKINTLRANRLAFLPADQIIIEKTVDGGATWTDAGVADSTKVGLFSETRAGVSIPLLDGSQNINCGLRITFTAMKYNVPANTAETNKYNYWNSEYIVSTERYNQLKEMYFWVSTSNNSMSIKVERATGANSTSWNTIYDSSSNNYGLTGWSGNDYIRFTQGVFGGGTTQTGNFWNYRLTFFTRGTNGSTTLNTGYLTSAQSIMEIRGYGDTWWTKGNEYAANDKIYTHDYLQNVTFPANVTATQFNGNLQATTINGVTVGSSPKFTDTDEKVSQSYKTASEYTYWRPLLIGYSAGSAATFTPSSTTNLAYTFSTLKVQPSTGTIRINNLALYKGSYTTTFTPTTLTADRTITVPDKTGTIALTSDITSAIEDLPEPMIFKGSVGTSGTVTWDSLATAAAANEGWTYKVITAHTAETGKPAAQVGDTIISNGSEWVVIPSGDEPSGTVTSVAAANATNGGLTISGSPITSSGTITIGHSNVLTSAQTTQAVYPIKIDKNGHISAYGTAVTIPTVPSSTGSSTTGVSIADHSSTSIYGVSSSTTSVTGVSGSTSVYGVKSGTNSTTTASKASGANGTAPTLGTAITVRGVKTGTSSTTTASKASGANGTAPSWTFEEKTIPNVTAAGSGSFTSGTFSGGSGSASLTFTMDTTDTKKLVIEFSHTHTPATHGADSHTHTAPTLGTAIKVQSKSGGSNGSASTWSFTDVTVPIRADADTSIPNVTSVGSASTWSFTDVTVPIRADSATTVPTAASSATTVPIKNGTATTVITSKTHSVTDNGHTHTI